MMTIGLMKRLAIYCHIFAKPMPDITSESRVNSRQELQHPVFGVTAARVGVLRESVFGAQPASPRDNLPPRNMGALQVRYPSVGFAGGGGDEQARRVAGVCTVVYCTAAASHYGSLSASHTPVSTRAPTSKQPPLGDATYRLEPAGQGNRIRGTWSSTSPTNLTNGLLLLNLETASSIHLTVF